MTAWWRWISPLDELPNDGDGVVFVLYPTDGNIDVTTDAVIGWYSVDEDGKGEFCTWESGHEDPIKPMWWMRLPEVPKTSSAKERKQL